MFEQIINAIHSQKARNEKAKDLLDIYNGSLLAHVDKKMKQELSNTAYLSARGRIPPINILTKLVEKLSGVYENDTVRTLTKADKNEQSLLSWYEDVLDFNSNMQLANEYFNFLKTALVQVFYSENNGVSMRVINEHEYYVYSEDETDKTNATHIIICNGSYKKREIECNKYIVYTDTFIYFIDEEGDRYQDDILNEFGLKNFFYINKSKTELVPNIDMDLMQMTTLFPLLLADLNFAIKFQSFSIIAIIDGDASNLKMNPSAIWNIKSLIDTERQASIQPIKPQVDIDQVSKHILSQLSMWLNTKGLKSSGITGGASDMSSAISKLVDESDASSNKKKQVHIFKNAERKIWDFIFQRFHSLLLDKNLIENKTLVTVGNKVSTSFSEQVPMHTRSDVVAVTQREVELGLLSKLSAIKRLNPSWTQERINTEFETIKNETVIEVFNDNKMATSNN